MVNGTTVRDIDHEWLDKVPVCDLGVKRNPFAVYLNHENPEPAAFEEAKKRFAHSIGVWWAISYVVGFGDRHQDNMLVMPNGTLLHIDFGWILGRDPKGMNRGFQVGTLRADSTWLEAIGEENLKTPFNVLQATFAVLRRQKAVLIPMIRAIGELEPDMTNLQVEDHINKVFMPGLTDEQARDKMLSEVHSSMDAKGSWIRDYIHEQRGLLTKTTNAVSNHLHYGAQYLGTAVGAVWDMGYTLVANGGPELPKLAMCGKH